MLIVGDNLQQLMAQHNISSNPSSFDVNSITLRLDPQIAVLHVPDDKVLTYGEEIPERWIGRDKIGADGLVLTARGAVLGCSLEKIQMPIGYCGFVQTKGSLARLFVSAICCDSQVEPGFIGKVTFEICNLGNHTVRIKAGDEVAQMFIVRASTKLSEPYHGRYQGADKPTISLPRQSVP
jgi:dCTP deaminase